MLTRGQLKLFGECRKINYYVLSSELWNVRGALSAQQNDTWQCPSRHICTSQSWLLLAPQWDRESNLISACQLLSLCRSLGNCEALPSAWRKSNSAGGQVCSWAANTGFSAWVLLAPLQGQSGHCHTSPRQCLKLMLWNQWNQCFGC